MWSPERRYLSSRQNGDCVPHDPASNVTDRLNSLLKTSGDGYVLQLCPGAQYLIQAPILFAHPDQEISTAGYPTGSDRATLIVSGPIFNSTTGHTTAVDGTCATCSGVKLRNVQIDGRRQGGPPLKSSGNIEMGGANADQVVEHVRSFDPRGWTCLHISEGPKLNCNNVTVQNNDIGPSGSHLFQQWADGVSVSCRNCLVRNNVITGATDGGIVLFGAPGTQVYNNTISIVNETLLGGINMVDYLPYNGSYTGTVVRDNVILGAFATSSYVPGQDSGTNSGSPVIKIGIAIGPHTWFGDRYGASVNRDGIVMNNKLSGAFSFGIAVASATNFTVQNNTFFGNTAFIGAPGVNCSKSEPIPHPAPFIVDANNTQNLSLQDGFQAFEGADEVTCLFPPDGGDYWPFPPQSESTHKSKLTTGTIVGVIIGVVGFIVVSLLVAFWVIRVQRNVSRKKKAGHPKDSLFLSSSREL